MFLHAKNIDINILKFKISKLSIYCFFPLSMETNQIYNK